MEAEILCRALNGSFGVSRLDEVAAVRHAVLKGWIEGLVCTARSLSPMPCGHQAIVRSITPEGLARLEELAPAALCT